MIKNDSVIDPLHENILPKWSPLLGVTHHSATQLLMSDGPYFLDMENYLKKKEEEYLVTHK